MDRVAPPPTSPHSSISAEDWYALSTTPCNVLLVGPEAATREVIELAKLCLPSPIAMWHVHKGRVPVIPPHGTVIINDIGALDASGQQDLADNACRPMPRARILATAAAPLFPLVQAEVFSEPLYYLLNTIHIVLGGITATTGLFTAPVSGRVLGRDEADDVHRAPRALAAANPMARPSA